MRGRRAAIMAGDDLTKPDTLEAAIPGKAIKEGSEDYLAPTRRTLVALNLLGTQADLAKADGLNGLLGKTPASVAVIESGATAISKWWAAGLGAAATAGWASLGTAWTSGNLKDVHPEVLWFLAITLAAAVLAISYIVGSDVRGRAAASVATIEARAKVADAIIRMAEAGYKPKPAPAEAQIIPLATPLQNVTNTEGTDSDGWTAILVKTDGKDVTEYLLVKDKEKNWVAPTHVRFAPPAATPAQQTPPQQTPPQQTPTPHTPTPHTPTPQTSTQQGHEGGN
jgi:hypothetical protein